MTVAQAQVAGPPLAIEEVVCLENMLERAKWTPKEVPFIQRNITILKEATAAGLARVPEDYALSLRLIDPMLRARWDFTCDLWAIERWVNEEDPNTHTWFNRWAFIAHRHNLDAKLIFDLKKGDTWKDGKSPEEHLREKREAAEAVQKVNEKKSTDIVLAAVDQLPSDHVRRFVEVEEAIASGDTINATGSDGAMLDRIATTHKKQLAAGTYTPPPATPAPYGRRRFKKVRKG